MQKKLVEQNKTIEYIRNKYKQKTGEDIVMPKSWEEYLSLDQEEVPSCPLPVIPPNYEENLTFLLAIDKLNLPNRLSYSKAPLTSFSPSNKFHMIQAIDLSNFKDKGFTKNSLRQLISRIVDMRCLKMINLNRNGIGQQCTEEVQSLLAIKRITRVDLSRNNMGKNCLQIISKNFNHLEWIDLSRNSFQFERVGLQALLNTIRVNGKIYHMQMDWQDDKMLTTFLSYLKLKSHLRSLGPIDSKITPQGMEYLCQVLEIKQSKKDNYRIFNLNFDFCYLEKPIFYQLVKAISFNNTIVRLILSNNHLGQESIRQLMKVMENNISIIQLNLAGNLLQDYFAIGLSQCFVKNQILQIVDISKNNIGTQGGKMILKSLSENNDTIQSLGSFQTNSRLGPQLIQKIKRALRINRVSKEVRSKILNEEPQLPVVQVTNRQTEAFLEAQFLQYELLEPISVTNPIKEDPFRLNIWKFE